MEKKIIISIAGGDVSKIKIPHEQYYTRCAVHGGLQEKKNN